MIGRLSDEYKGIKIIVDPEIDSTDKNPYCSHYLEFGKLSKLKE